MNQELLVARANCKLALQAMTSRRKRLQNTRSKLSRHYSTARHTDAMIALLEELLGFMMQDPEEWDNEEELLPF